MPRYYDPLRAFQQLGDKEILKLALETMTEGLKIKLPLFEKAISTGDSKALKLLLHDLKGSVPLLCSEAFQKELTDSYALISIYPDIMPLANSIYEKLLLFFNEIEQVTKNT
jgi:hypothetical protein